MWHFIKHLPEHIVEHMWNTMVIINSILLTIACGYVVYAAGASIYYVTFRPIELGIILVLILICTEVVLAAIEEVAG
jgi:hypothetical protein